MIDNIYVTKQGGKTIYDIETGFHPHVDFLKDKWAHRSLTHKFTVAKNWYVFPYVIKTDLKVI